MVNFYDVKDGLNNYFDDNLDIFLNAFGGLEKFKSIFFNELDDDNLEIKNYLSIFSKDNLDLIENFMDSNPSRGFIVTTYIDIIDYLYMSTKVNTIIYDLRNDIILNVNLFKETMSEDEKLHYDTEIEFINDDKSIKSLTATIFYLILKYYLKEFISKIKEK